MVLYVGKLPRHHGGDHGGDHGGHPPRPLMGFDGSIARLRFHARALSPIHVRVDCEKGPPSSATTIPDEACFQLLLLLLLAARSTASRTILSGQKWMLLLFDIAKYGTNRVRQGVFRLLRTLLSAMPPTRVEQVLSLPAPEEEEHNNGFVKWLLNEIGTAMTTTTTTATTTATTTINNKKKKKKKKKNDFQTNFLTMHEEQFRLSKTMQANNTGKEDEHPPLMSCAEIAHYTCSQVTEAISLLRHLASCSNTKWPKVVRYVLPFCVEGGTLSLSSPLLCSIWIFIQGET